MYSASSARGAHRNAWEPSRNILFFAVRFQPELGYVPYKFLEQVAEFRGKPFSGSRIVTCGHNDGETDMTKVTNVFFFFLLKWSWRKGKTYKEVIQTNVDINTSTVTLSYDSEIWNLNQNQSQTLQVAQTCFSDDLWSSLGHPTNEILTSDLRQLQKQSMEAASSSKVFKYFYQTARRYNPEESSFQTILIPLRTNIKPYK
jgi:hypothetical protein